MIGHAGWTSLCNNRARCPYAAALLLFILMLPPRHAQGATAGNRATPAADDSSSLAATSAVPWNPATPAPSRQAWERVVLLPGQVVSLPLSGVGLAMRRSLLFIEQNTSALSMGQRKRVVPERGIFPQLPGLGDRTGLGLAGEVRTPVLGGALRSRASARYAGTMLGYNSTLLGVTGRPLGIQYGYDWRPQDQFYGIGSGASRDSLSDYAMQREFVRGRLRWGWDEKDGLHPPGTVLMLWGGPRSEVTRTGREDGRVSYDQRFPALGAATLDRRVENLVYGASLSRDRRSGHPHWAHGERVLLSAERYDVPIRALALHDGEARGAQFTRFGFESETGVSFMRDPRTVRLLVKGIDQNVTAGGDRFLISDLATLGGHEGLMGFQPGRFHDLDMLVARLTYLFPLLRGLEMDVHSEWGAVYHDVWSDAKLSTLENSVGFSVRARSPSKPLASAGLEFSRESVRLRFSLGGLE